MFPTLKQNLIEASKIYGSHQDRANAYFFALLPICQIVQNELMKISSAMPEEFPKVFLSVETQSFYYLNSNENQWKPLCIDNDYLYLNFVTPVSLTSSIVAYIENKPLNLSNKTNVEIPEIVINSFHTLLLISQTLQEVLAPVGNISTIKIKSDSINISIEVQDHEGEGHVNFHSHN